MMKRSRCGSVGRTASVRRMLPCMTVLFLTVATAIATPTAAIAGDGAASVSSEAIFIAELGLLLLVGRLMGEAAQRLGQPAVMGQLIGGLLLGPSVLGLIWPAAQHALFPGTPEQKSMINAVSQLGILMLLLLTGMETDLQLVKRVGRAAVTVAATGVALPFSSVKIVAMVVREMNFMRRDLGQIIVASAILEDTIGWVIIAVALGLASAGTGDLWSPRRPG